MTGGKATTGWKMMGSEIERGNWRETTWVAEGLGVLKADTRKGFQPES